MADVSGSADLAALDRLAPLAAAVALGLEPPVLVAPPSKASPHWSARTDTQDRPLRAKVWFDADGTVRRRRARQPAGPSSG